MNCGIMDLIISVALHVNEAMHKTTRHWNPLPQTINYLQNSIFWILGHCPVNDYAQGSVF